MSGPTRPASGTGVTVIPSRMRASVVNAVPVSMVDYIELHLEALLDTRGMHRRVSDIQVILDYSVLDVGKVFADGISLDDVLALASEKGVVDLVSLTDQVSRQVDYIRPFSETVSLSDVVVSAFGKGLTDGVTVTDTYTQTLQKTLADVFGLNDSLQFNDGSTTGVQKRVGNTFALSDAAATTLDKKQSDSVDFTDSGALICQGYVDPSYFAEAYVGESRTF